jgi:glycoprotein endo-alpha-1,2-mannosidase
MHIEVLPPNSTNLRRNILKSPLRPNDLHGAEHFIVGDENALPSKNAFVQKSGLFLCRFTMSVDVVGYHHQSDLLLPSNNKILENVQRGAQKNGRTYAIMYDLSGMPKGEMKRIMEDWRQLNKSYRLREDIAYQGHRNKPLVAIWGVGFDDGRKYDFDDVAELIEFFKNDPEYGGCSVALGLPAYWRAMERDSSKDPAFHALIKKSDLVIPWSIGRFGGVAAAQRHGKEVFAPDIQWCKEAGVDYLPTVFPGFSWANRYKKEKAKLDHIPREGGRFLWSQCIAAKKAGAEMVYVAMFDEMDEGTQIFKVTKNPPLGSSPFLDYGTLPEDFYLRLTGKAGALMRGELPLEGDLPKME